MVKCLKVVEKYIFYWIFFMMPSIVLLSIQMYNIKMRPSKIIVESNAQKQMAKSGFERDFHDLKYFEFVYCFHIFKIVMKLMSS